ncbi:hypothetical protein ABIA70_003611 [Arthrobacter sp. 754]
MHVRIGNKIVAGGLIKVPERGCLALSAGAVLFEDAGASRDAERSGEDHIMATKGTVLVVGAHGCDSVWRAGGDYPLLPSRELLDKLVRIYRRVQPTVVLTHPLVDPYNAHHPAAACDH